MPMCRSPPFLSKNADKKEMEEIKCQKNITFMSTDKGLKSASRYIKSTGEKKNTKSIQSKWTRKTTCSFFSSLDHDGHFVDNIVDESVDVEKIVETQMMIEAVRNAISRLNAEEKDIIERLYFNDEAVVLMTREQTEVINYEYFMRQLSQSDSDAVTANR